MNELSPYLKLSNEVQTALQEQRPIVALESTVIAHGLPYPTNVEVAQTMEEVIHNEGAIPATVGIHGGKIMIGLNKDEIERLGTAQDVLKVSRRDLAVAMATDQLGATTVAGTMLCASMAGIRFFATGGIGGVHRGAETSMDISADLTELSRTPVLVVCAGAKSILDLDLTLEYLETQGVPVIGRQTDEFPAFYVRSSGWRLTHRADDVSTIAAIAPTAPPTTRVEVSNVRLNPTCNSPVCFTLRNPITFGSPLALSFINPRLLRSLNKLRGPKGNIPCTNDALQISLREFDISRCR